MRRGALVAMLACLAATCPARADELGLDVRDGPDGKSVEIVRVGERSPAAAESLQPGDLVIQVQGVGVATAGQYRQAVLGALGYGEVGLLVTRTGWARHVRLKPALTGAFGVITTPRATGAEVVAVAPGSPGAIAGLQPGDVITMADGRLLYDKTDFQQLAAPFVSQGRPLDIAVRRADWTKTLTLGGRAPAVAASIPQSPPPASPAPVPASPPPAPASPPRIPSPAPVEPLRAGEVTDEVRAGNQAYDAQNWAEAEARYGRVVRALPDESSAWARMCHAQVMQSKFKEAAETCKSASNYAAADASVFQNLGYTLFRLGRYVDSIEPYRKASELKPEWALPYASAGASYYALADWPRTEVSYRLAVERDPANARAWQSRGDAATALRKPADAVAHYRRAQAAGGGSPELSTLLGWAYFDMGQLKEAESAFREANRLDPKDANVLLVLGLVADRQGKADEAREAWQRAAALGGDGEAGTKARQNLANLDARLAGRSATAPVPQPARPGPAPTARAPAEEPRMDVRPETDSGI
jgi:tetratricopeptide (TPR) repeat protein